MSRADSPTEDLAERAARGEAAALTALARHWWPAIRRWCLLQLGDPASAEEASQEVLAALSKAMGALMRASDRDRNRRRAVALLIVYRRITRAARRGNFGAALELTLRLKQDRASQAA